MLQLFQRLLGRAPKTQLPPFNFARSRYKAKKIWPPTLRELTEKQQFRFERKFKRRIRLKSIRPNWDKWVKIVQWSLIGFITVYGVFFHDFANEPVNPRPGEQPFKGLRNWMWGLTEGFWTHSRALEGARDRDRDRGPRMSSGASTEKEVRERIGTAESPPRVEQA